jgi:hypothetical protein
VHEDCLTCCVHCEEPVYDNNDLVTDNDNGSRFCTECAAYCTHCGDVIRFYGEDEASYDNDDVEDEDDDDKPGFSYIHDACKRGRELANKDSDDDDGSDEPSEDDGRDDE